MTEVNTGQGYSQTSLPDGDDDVGRRTDDFGIDQTWKQAIQSEALIESCSLDTERLDVC
jgi:hypothetical protein